jgi:hypothetical protein
MVKRLFYSMVGAVFVCTGLWLQTLPAAAQFSYIPTIYNGPTELCRMGINGPLHNYLVNPLRLGWYIDYTASATPPAGMEYFPVIRLEQTSTGYNYSYLPGRAPATEQELRDKVASLPGHYWIIGNEPDRINLQDDMEPHMYARAYHDLYTIIKDEDPTAKIVAGAIVQPTPLRITYLDMVLASYQSAYLQPMPVDAWAFHNFILNEASCDHYKNLVDPDELGGVCWGAEIPPGVAATDGLRITVQENDDIDLFKAQVIRFRQWMADNGYRNTPAFLSEFGVLMPAGKYPEFNAQRVNTFMDASFDFLMTGTDPNTGYPGDNNRLVQRFAWYSTDDNRDFNGFLFNPQQAAPNNRTPIGDNFATYAKNMDASLDYYLDKVSVVGAPVNSQDGMSVTLEAVIGNSGNLAHNTTAIVRFYNGDPFNGGVQVGSDQYISVAGCGEKSAVRTEWGGAQPGSYTIFARVQVLFSDVNSGNNQLSLPVTFAP